jgi:hypothetical protein
MISPTGWSETRMDAVGSGQYRAKRGHRKHAGRDYEFATGVDPRKHQIVAPINGRVVREARPYANEKYSGCVIEGSCITIKMFYFKFNKRLIGTVVKQGDPLGLGQDIGEKYGKECKAHIHLQVERVDPDVFINPWKMPAIY